MESLAVLGNMLYPVSKRNIGEKRSVTPNFHSYRMSHVAKYKHEKVLFVRPIHLEYQIEFGFGNLNFYLIEGNDEPQLSFNWTVVEQELCYAETQWGTPYTTWVDVNFVPVIHVGVRREKVGNLFKYTMVSASTDAPPRAQKLNFYSEPEIDFSEFWTLGKVPVEAHKYNINGNAVDVARWLEKSMPIEEKQKIKSWGIVPPDVVEEWGDTYFVFNGQKIEIADPSDFNFELNREHHTDWNRYGVNHALSYKEDICRYETKKGLQTGVRLFEDGKIVSVFENKR